MSKKIEVRCLPASELGNTLEAEEKALQVAEEIGQAIDENIEDLTQIKQIVNVLKYNLEQISYHPGRVEAVPQMAQDVLELSRYVRHVLTGRVIDKSYEFRRLSPAIVKEREAWLKRIEEKKKTDPRFS